MVPSFRAPHSTFKAAISRATPSYLQMRPSASYSCRAPQPQAPAALPLGIVRGRRAAVACSSRGNSCAQSASRHAAVRVLASAQRQQQEGAQEVQRSIRRDDNAPAARALAVPAPLEPLWTQLAQLLGLRGEQRYRFQVYESQASSPPASAAPPVAEVVRDAVVSAAEVAARAPSIAAAAAASTAGGAGQALNDVNRWARVRFLARNRTWRPPRVTVMAAVAETLFKSHMPCLHCAGSASSRSL